MRILLFLSLFCLPSFVWAHSVAGESGWVSGFSHPVLGLDHLLAMLCVGMLSTRMGKRGIWALPTTFVTVMLLGGILGIASIPLPGVETGIALSVLVFGSALLWGGRLPTGLSYAGVALFAMFHGHAHGGEMPELAEPVAFATGFMAGTTVIHLVGVCIGLIFAQLRQGDALLKVTGLGMAGSGLWFLFS